MSVLPNIDLLKALSWVEVMGPGVLLEKLSALLFDSRVGDETIWIDYAARHRTDEVPILFKLIVVFG